MATHILPGPASIVSDGDSFHPSPNDRFASRPPNTHERQWISHPDHPDYHNHPDRKRTLVLCFDGTGNSFDQDNSNVVQFLAMLKKDDPAKQLVYYQAGIGTYTGDGVIGTSIAQRASQMVDQMIAWNLPSHIKDGYRFLMQNYRAGDRICIFGFSRGAFTARALAGMLQKVGLLPPCNTEQLPFAYAMYARDDKEGIKLSEAFKETFSMDVQVHFLGVWDTVQSVGTIPRHVPFARNDSISFFRHALSLDEHRVKFIPFFYTDTKKSREQTTDPKYPVSEHSDGHYNAPPMKKRELSGKSSMSKDVLSPVEEVFFAGAHCDVGGGSVKTNERHSLARIPLRWMIRECLKVNSGIIFDSHKLKHRCGLDLDSITEAPAPAQPETHFFSHSSTLHKGFTLGNVPRAIYTGVSAPFRWVGNKFTKGPPSSELSSFEYEGEAEEELKDALSPIYDQMKVHTYWRVMEWIPWIVKKQHAEVADSDTFWDYKFVWNRGQGREVYSTVMKRDMKVHRSVRTRIQAQGMGRGGKPYNPKVRLWINEKPQRLKREDWLKENPEHFIWVD